jgi:hypothetical protein
MRMFNEGHSLKDKLFFFITGYLTSLGFILWGKGGGGGSPPNSGSAVGGTGTNNQGRAGGTGNHVGSSYASGGGGGEATPALHLPSQPRADGSGTGR